MVSVSHRTTLSQIRRHTSPLPKINVRQSYGHEVNQISNKENVGHILGYMEPPQPHSTHTQGTGHYGSPGKDQQLG